MIVFSFACPFPRLNSRGPIEAKVTAAITASLEPFRG